MTSRSYRDLLVWQKGIDLVETIYALTEGFPKQETYGLANQLQRCAASVPSNIAEGQGRNTNKEFRRFLYVAVGSLAELDTQIEIAKRLSTWSKENMKIFRKQFPNYAECSLALSIVCQKTKLSLNNYLLPTVYYLLVIFWQHLGFINIPTPGE